MKPFSWLVGTKIFCITLALLFACFSMALPAQASEFHTGNNYSLDKSQTINEDLYSAAGTTSIDGTVNGDVFVAGGNITINGNVSGSVFVAGGNIILNGTVGDDIHATGGQIVFHGKVTNDFIAAGGSISLEKDSSVGGVTKVAGGQATFAGTTKTAAIATGQLSLASTAKVEGDLNYASGNQASVANGATITGKTEFKKIDTTKARQREAEAAVISAILWALASLLLLRFFPNKAARMAESIGPSFGKNFLWGIIFFIVGPIVCLIGFILFPIGLILTMLYVLALILGQFALIFGLGHWIEERWQRRTTIGFWGIVLAIIILTAIRFVPIIGPLATYILWVAGIGAVVSYDWSLYQNLRADKKL